MEIKINTKEDSAEDIKKAIKFLSDFVETESSLKLPIKETKAPPKTGLLANSKAKDGKAAAKKEEDAENPEIIVY